MRYRLVVLTHGESATLRDTLASYMENVTPEPVETRLVYDGNPLRMNPDLNGLRFPPPLTLHHPMQGDTGTDWSEGFCKASRRAWDAACSDAVQPAEYAFWLEHDFMFTRPVDLMPLADVLDDYPLLAQISLMRGPENGAERRAGGVIEALMERGQAFVQYDHGGHPWMHHEAYFTTNPSLMRTGWMKQNPWLAEEEQCEGKFGLALRRRGYSFGVWGKGEPWVRHTGERTGHGY